MKYLQDVCRKAGFKPNLRIVPDISTQLLWIESGLGISLFNEKSMAFSGAGLKAVHLNDLPPRRLILTWKKDSANPSVRLFVHLMSCCL
jgi:DNA-binding transcriptional LysR family regulator